MTLCERCDWHRCVYGYEDESEECRWKKHMMSGECAWFIPKRTKCYDDLSGEGGFESQCKNVR